MKENALVVAGIIFFVVFVAHLARLILKTEVKVAGRVMPMWLSIIGAVVSLSLSAWIYVILSA